MLRLLASNYAHAKAIKKRIETAEKFSPCELKEKELEVYICKFYFLLNGYILTEVKDVGLYY